MTAPDIRTLREPPVPGRYYMVPAVFFTWFGRETWWPVLGPMHTDAEHLQFPHRHYHIDARFVTARMARALGFYDEIDVASQSYPLAQRHGSTDELPKGRPLLRRMRCRTNDYPYHHHGQPNIAGLRLAYGDEGPDRRAEPIRLADGRILCPHRKVDLSSFAPDGDGVVTCPLHGLMVQCERKAA